MHLLIWHLPSFTQNRVRNGGVQLADGHLGRCLDELILEARAHCDDFCALLVGPTVQCADFFPRNAVFGEIDLEDRLHGRPVLHQPAS